MKASKENINVTRALARQAEEARLATQREQRQRADLLARKRAEQDRLIAESGAV